jgi:hypothetical protein
MSTQVDRTTSQEKISIWFFLGTLVLIYGVVLLTAGVYQIWHPPQVVLAKFHATSWWGAFMVLAGLFYTLRFWPIQRASVHADRKA